MGKLASTSTPRTARPGPRWISSWALLPTPALELQKCIVWGLDQAMAPSTTFNNTSDAPDDVGWLPEPLTNCVELLGSSSMETNSSQLLQKLNIVTQTL